MSLFVDYIRLIWPCCRSTPRVGDVKLAIVSITAAYRLTADLKCREKPDQKLQELINNLS